MHVEPSLMDSTKPRGSLSEKPKNKNKTIVGREVEELANQRILEQRSTIANNKNRMHKVFLLFAQGPGVNGP
jgi:hypothetical protein